MLIKASTALISEGEPIVTPPGCTNLHQEVELAVVIGKLAKVLYFLLYFYIILFRASKNPRP